MTTQMNISRRRSFRYETTAPSLECRGVCVVSSETNKKHILTSTVDLYTKKDEKYYIEGRCKRICNKDDTHDDSLHCQYSATYDMDHAHLSYNNRDDMLEALRHRFPEEHKQILETLDYNSKQKNNASVESRYYPLDRHSTKWEDSIKVLFDRIASKK